MAKSRKTTRRQRPAALQDKPNGPPGRRPDDGRPLVERPEVPRRQAVPVEVEPGYPESWRRQLHESTQKVKREHVRQRELIAQAIAAGATWSEVASALGVRRQTAWERYRHLVPVVRTESG